MTAIMRHQCLIYEGSPVQYLKHLTAVVSEKLHENWRCAYFNSPAMVAGIRSYLSAAGIDVFDQISRGALMLSSDQSHIVNGRFRGDLMLQMLSRAANDAVRDGYSGLWATGDMTWELGPEKDISRLLDYEWQLEEMFRMHPQLSGVCQYHIDSLPANASKIALHTHQAVFINETLSRLNPDYRAGIDGGSQRWISPDQSDSR